MQGQRVGVNSLPNTDSVTGVYTLRAKLVMPELGHAVDVSLKLRV